MYTKAEVDETVESQDVITERDKVRFEKTGSSLNQQGTSEILPHQENVVVDFRNILNKIKDEKATPNS